MIALTLVSAALLCACSPAAPVREAPKHVIVICIDALRADHLGAYGYHRNTSPTIDRLAREGVLFERAFSNSSFTGESVSTIFTGAYPSRTPWGGGWYAAPDPLRENIAARMTAAGYYTALFANTPVVDHKPFYKEFHAYACLVKNFGLSGAGPKLSRKALEFLARHANKKTFMYLHYLDPHSPYTPPEAYYKRFAPALFDAPLSLTEEARPRLPDLRKEGFGPGEARFEDIVLRYDAEIAFVDDAIQQLLAGLEAAGLLNETLIVITADHGEEFLDHDFVEHAWQLYPESIHVPLIFWWPGKLAPGRSLRASSLVDLLPTLLSFAGHPPEDSSLDGAPIFAWQDPAGWTIAEAGAPIISELLLPTRNIVRSVIHNNYQYLAAPLWNDWRDCAALSTQQHALREAFLTGSRPYPDLWGAPVYEALFRLDSDFEARHNVIEEAVEAREACRVLLKAYAAQCPKALPDTFKHERKTEALESEEIEMLKALGYLGEGVPAEVDSARPENEEALKSLGYL